MCCIVCLLDEELIKKREYRIVVSYFYFYLYDMKVTAILPDLLVEEVKSYTNEKTITKSLLTALSDWLQVQKIKQLNAYLKDNPLEFAEGYSAQSIRNLNR